MLPFRNTLEESRCKCCNEWFPWDHLDEGYCPDCIDKKMELDLEEAQITSDDCINLEVDQPFRKS